MKRKYVCTTGLTYGKARFRLNNRGSLSSSFQGSLWRVLPALQTRRRRFVDPGAACIIQGREAVLFIAAQGTHVVGERSADRLEILQAQGGVSSLHGADGIALQFLEGDFMKAAGRNERNIAKKSL